MDKEMVVEKLKRVIKEFENKKGEFSLVMLIPTEPTLIDSKFTLLISAPWLDKEDQKKGIELITDCLRRFLNDKEFSFIARVTIIHSSDKSVKAINSAFKAVKNNIIRLTNINAFGVQIDEAILIDRYRGPRDDWGEIIYRDDYLSRQFDDEKITGSGTIDLSTDTAYRGDFSLKMTTGTNIGDNNNIKYLHTEFHKQKVGTEIRFASASDAYAVQLRLEYHDGYNKLYTGTIIADSETGLYIINQNNEKVLINASRFPIYKNIKAWNWIKLIIDLSTKKYVRIGINGDDKIDISNQHLQVTTSELSRRIISNITVFGSPTGGAATVYFDQYIFTEGNQ